MDLGMGNEYPAAGLAGMLQSSIAFGHDSVCTAHFTRLTKFIEKIIHGGRFPPKKYMNFTVLFP
jgi:hypothetical protein